MIDSKFYYLQRSKVYSLISLGLNRSSVYKTEKAHLMNIIDILDTKAETIPLNSDERRIYERQMMI
jgi:hypothetical protein